MWTVTLHLVHPTAQERQQLRRKFGSNCLLDESTRTHPYATSAEQVPMVGKSLGTFWVCMTDLQALWFLGHPLSARDAPQQAQAQAQTAFKPRPGLQVDGEGLPLPNPPTVLFEVLPILKNPQGIPR